jgi:hypothetical protein
MSEEKRHEALRKFSYKSAAAETEAELSGLAESFHRALIDEALAQRFPKELRGIEDAKAALDIAATVYKTTQIALENEIKASGATVQEPTPKEPSEPWI